MRGSWRVVVAIAFVWILLAGWGSVSGHTYDMVEDSWLPLTHRHLRARATLCSDQRRHRASSDERPEGLDPARPESDCRLSLGPLVIRGVREGVHRLRVRGRADRGLVFPVFR